MPPDHPFPPKTETAASADIVPRTVAPSPSLPRTETYVCHIKVLLTYTVGSPNAVNVVIVESFLPTLIPISTESAASDGIAQGTVAPSLSLPQERTIVCQFEVDRTFLGRAIPAISTGVIQSFFAPAP